MSTAMTESSVSAAHSSDANADELRALHAMESWGATLSLTGIVLSGKQLVDWSEDAKYSAVHEPIFLAPMILGLMAFIFLRVVNYRIRNVRGRQSLGLHGTNDTPYEKFDSFGSVGWAQALMPLIIGWLESAYFIYYQHGCCFVAATGLIDVVVVLVAEIFFLRQNAATAVARAKKPESLSTQTVHSASTLA